MLKELRIVFLITVVGILMIVGMIGVIAPIEPPVSPSKKMTPDAPITATVTAIAPPEYTVLVRSDY